MKNAFLHRDLKEEVYMEIHLVLLAKGQGKVCRLKKALYGLKQSPRARFNKFSKVVVKFGDKQNNDNHTLVIKHCNGKIITLIVYVEDITVTGNDY